MGGEGSMTWAITSFKNNRALLKKRKIRELKDVLYEVSGKTAVEFREISPLELQRVKAKIRCRARRAVYYEIMAYVGGVVGAALIIGFVWWIFTP
ncbi:hypothetical protein OZ410_13410 [Robiginitalea sp. M366]|uniref:hypothetical protein n=1 Tax=Robiginitalea aestuariiviva TaxID=3036903 RepID=UPI00240DD15A|nr:hypothetical protein [Robiginitalea aestuariiviva]MDG1573321.1 hypothetical protein [Robiginitalea aestuariiviva]